MNMTYIDIDIGITVVIINFDKIIQIIFFTSNL